jgi:hypothetical protein
MDLQHHAKACGVFHCFMLVVVVVVEAVPLPSAEIRLAAGLIGSAVSKNQELELQGNLQWQTLAH